MNLLCFGTPMTDLLIQVEDTFLFENAIQKGATKIVDFTDLWALKSRLTDWAKFPGGSASNTAVAFSCLGGRSAFFGCLGNDVVGKEFVNSLSRNKVMFCGTIEDKQKVNSGTVLVFVSPDGTRSMISSPGSSLSSLPRSIDQKIVVGFDTFLLESYLLESKNGTTFFQSIANIRQRKKVKIALSLSDPCVVVRARHFLLNFISRHVDILIGNQAEYESLFNCELKQSSSAIDQIVSEGVVTCGESGAVVRTGNEWLSVPTSELSVIDTTGAGDAFAAGYLYGRSLGWTCSRSASLGNCMAGSVVTKLGPRVLKCSKKLIKSRSG